MSMNRRDLLKRAAVAGVGAAASATPAAASERARPPEDALGMLYDATLCIGCRACVGACKEANNLGGNYFSPQDLSGNTKNIIKLYEEDGERSYVKRQCMHCLDPSCTNACMIGALQKREHGIVTWDGSRCIGCRYCQVACPFNVPKFEWGKAVPKIVKCELCLHRIKEGQGPACCEICPQKAVIYGKYPDLLAEARKRVAEHPEKYYPQPEPRIYGESDLGGTQVLYLASVSFDKLGLPDIGDEPVAHLARSVQHGAYRWGAAPVALYGILGAVMWRNRRAQKGKEEG